MTNKTTNPPETTANKKTPKLRFKGFVGEWEKCQLSDISEIIGGGTPSTLVADYWNGNINWYSPTEIGTNVYADESVKKITTKGLENSSAKMLPANRTILFTSRAGIGDMAILRHEACTNQGFQSLVLNEKAEPYFIYSMGYLIKDYALKHASGSTFLEISSKQLNRMPLALPCKIEQQKIGSFFQQLDTNLTQHQTQLEKLKNLKQAMLHKMFPQNGATEPEIRFKGFTGEWKAQNLEAITNPVSNNSLSRAKLNYKFGTAKNIHYGDILVRFDAVLDANRQDLPFITEQSEVDKLVGAALQLGDIVFADAAEDETVGKSVELAVASKQPVFAGLHTITFRPTYNFATGYLGYYTNSESYRKQLYPLMQGTKVLSLSRNSLKSTYISHPETLQEQQKIANYFRKLDQLITLQTTQLKKLQQIKQVCLTGMFV